MCEGALNAPQITQTLITWSLKRELSKNVNAIISGEILRFAQDDGSALAPWHHLEQKTPEVFGLRNCRKNRMVGGLFELTDASRGTAAIHKSIRDSLQKWVGAYVMRA